MKTEYYTNRWLRRFEIVTLVVAIISPPLLIFVKGVQVLQSSSSNSINYNNAIVMIIVGIIFILTFDFIFGSILKHYLYHQETRDDVIGARLSVILIFGSIYIYYILFLLS